MTKFVIINKTPHALNINGVVIEPTLPPARVSSSHEVLCELENGMIVFKQIFGEIENLPEKVPGQIILVSSIVLSAAKELGITGVMAPATGHPGVVRNAQGHIVSVPGITI